MDKRHLRHVWKIVRHIKPWYFLILAIASGFIMVNSLRSNNQHMVILRDAVYAADRDDKDVLRALQTLQAYVTTHMNTNLSSGVTAVYPPIQLKYTYERLVKARSAQLAANNATVYSEAQAKCESENSKDFSGRNRVPCIEAYVQSHTMKAVPIQDSLYKFAFISPRWSPDAAGWSMLATICFGIMFVTTLLSYLWFKRQLK